MSWECSQFRKKYVVGIDQSTQGTKALLFDEKGVLCRREDLAHRQIVSENGWVSHDPSEIYQNTVAAVQKLIENAKIDKNEIACIGISNQRETSLIWDKVTGKPIADAVVWQCARSADICRRIEEAGVSDLIRRKTGLKLSPYFPASKLAWLIENTDGARKKAERHELCFGTIDTWLIYKLTEGRAYKTDYSNASRTQLFNIFTLEWDDEVCDIFGINKADLAEVCDSDSCFGTTTLGGYLDIAVPIHSVFGDSHGALFGHGCLRKGMIKTTYGTGASAMMNIGETPILTERVVTSLAWKIKGVVHYVFEGNINYAGAVISWLKDDVELIDSAAETESLCMEAIQDDGLYLVPAFTGLGAPYWNSEARAMLSGITRTTGKAEIVRAAIESIAYQVADVIEAMSKEAGIPIKELRVDGGPTRNSYLMQFQSDILDTNVYIPDAEEFSGIGAAYAAGLGLGIYHDDIFDSVKYKRYTSKMEDGRRMQKLLNWKKVIDLICK